MTEDQEGWYKTSEKLPPDDRVVEAQSVVGHMVKLRYAKRFWWRPDMTMQVYYTPKRWRLIK